MTRPIILASGSAIRAQLLRQAGIDHTVETAKIDEAMVTESMTAAKALPRDIADTLAEMKARKVSDKHPEALVIGCDQVLDHRGGMLNKPATPDDALRQLKTLRDDRHSLLSAAVICEGGRPIWRHVGQARLRMRKASDAYLDDYVARNWDSIQHAVGCYKLEEEGVRLFTAIEGDYFHVLGMPLLELLNYLTLRGDIPS